MYCLTRTRTFYIKQEQGALGTKSYYKIRQSKSTYEISYSHDVKLFKTVVFINCIILLQYIVYQSRYSNKTIRSLYYSDVETVADCFAKAANYYDEAKFQIERGGLAVTDPAYKTIVKNHKLALKVLMDERRSEQVKQFYQVSLMQK